MGQREAKYQDLRNRAGTVALRLLAIQSEANRARASLKTALDRLERYREDGDEAAREFVEAVLEMIEGTLTEIAKGDA